MPLFADITEIQEYIPVVNNSIEVSSLQRHIDRVINYEIISITSRQMFDEIITNPTQFADILELIKQSAVAFACCSYVNLNAIQISDAGNLQTKTDGQQIARLQDIENFKVEVMDIAYKALDQIAIYLEDHQAETVIPTGGSAAIPKYKKWIDSTSFTIFQNCFIHNASEFHTYVNIRLSRRVFMHLKPAIKRVEMLKIQALLGSNLYTELKKTQTDAVRKALVENLIIPAVANLAFANGINELALIVDKYDTTTQFSNINANNTKGYTQAAESQIARTQAEREADGF